MKRCGIRQQQNKKENPKEENKMRTEYRSSWAKLILKVQGKNPLECPDCGSKMKVKEIVIKDIENELRRLNIKVWIYKEGDVIHKF